MNWLTFIFVVLLLFSLTDFMWPGQKKLHRQLYELAFFVTYFLFTIKYYYGPDIATYVPVYENIESPQTLLEQGSEYSDLFEFGYLFFCSILHYVGVSFWLMTVIISTLYFYAIHKLFKQIPSKKIFALLILVILDYNLIYIEYRQCIAVSFYILMVMAYTDRHYIRMFIFFCVISLTHKSGLYLSVLTLLTLFFFGDYKASKYNYWLLAATLILLCIVSTKEILSLVIGSLPLPSKASTSIIHHLSLERKVQVVFFLYFIAICITSAYVKGGTVREDMKKMQWIVFVGLFVVVFLYQYFYLLNRVRSYFLPFIITFVFRLVENEDRSFRLRHMTLFNQVSVLLVYVIMTHYIITSNLAQGKLKSNVAEVSIVFERMTKSQEELRQRQMAKAKIYWEQDFNEQFQ